MILAVVFWQCGSQNSVITPRVTDVVESVYASGVVKSKNQYELFTKSPGIVVEIFVYEGDSVKKGTPIFKIENINSSITAENARLNALANDYQVNIKKLAEAQNAILLAQKKLTNDSILLIRQQELWNQNIGSKVELEQKELNFENARLNLMKAYVNYQDLNRQLKLASDQSKNNFKIAQSNADDYVLKSDLDGFVYKINVKQGELATSMKSLAVLGQANFVMELNVDEFDIVKIKKDQPVIVRMDSYKNQVFKARVSFIYPMMDERTRTFKVEAVFTDFPPVLYPNLTLESNIVIAQKKQVLTIPTAYLVNDSTVLLEDGTLQTLLIGLKDDSITEVLRGIDANTKIRLPKN